MLTDRYGLELATSSREAHDLYRDAVDRMLATETGAQDRLTAAVEADPLFALPHAALARHHQSAGQTALAREHASRATELARGTTVREQQHTEIARRLVNGDSAGGFALIVEHIAEFPLDALALAPATGVFGLIGFSGRSDRESEQIALLRPLAAHYGDDWWFQTAYAFALLETGEWEHGRRLAERALAQRPGSPHGAHTLAHALYEAGDDATATEFLEHWLPTSDRGNLLHCHLWWHYSLLLMGSGHHHDAWQAFSENCLPGTTDSPAINVFTDAASFLWRSELAGAERSTATWQLVRDFLEAEFAQPMVFIDAHAGLPYIALGDAEGLQRVTAQLAELGETGRLPAGTTAVAITRAFDAFAAQRWTKAIDLLEPVLGEVVRIGGSRAQRDIVSNTLLAAYVMAGRIDSAVAHLEAITDRRPSRPVLGLPA